MKIDSTKNEMQRGRTVYKNVKVDGRHIKQVFAFSIMGLGIVFTMFFLLSVIGFVFSRGVGVINWTFITDMPRQGMTAGGIYPAILGTIYLIMGAVLFSAPLGVLSAIYLTEYASQNIVVRIIRIGINNLSGVPSVVFGLFGLSVFVKYFGFGVSILSGSLTLGILILPTIIRSAEEALKVVPQAYREASLALGGTKWQTIRNVVLPAALPGILTGCILGIGRAAGETAPIMFTAVTFFSMRLPNSIFSEVQALPYLIYALVAEGIYPDKQVPIAFGAALVLLVIVLGVSSIAIIIRAVFRVRRAF